MVGDSDPIVNFSPELEHLLDRRIGYGKAQRKLVTPLAFLMIS